MIGNVWEWTYDWYLDRLPGGDVVDPTGPAKGTMRVFHGGGWHRSSSGLSSRLATARCECFTAAAGTAR